jgi:hypothetical protein
MQWLTQEMADRANRYVSADRARRHAKLHRLNPNPSPYTNLMSPALDYEEGDPERIDDFLPSPTSCP